MAYELKTIKEFAMDLVERVKHELDSTIIIESAAKKGLAKTSFTIILNQAICALMGYEYSLKETIVFDATSEKIIERIHSKPVCWPVHIDEASKAAYKRNFNKEDQKDLVIFLNVCRTEMKIIELNNPTFWGLDGDVRELADYRVTMIERGLCVVRGKIADSETKDVWVRDETEKMIKSHVPNAKRMDPMALLGALRQTPNYLFEIKFPDVDPAIYAEYKRMKGDSELERFFAAGTNKYKLGFEALLAIVYMERSAFPFSKKQVVRGLNAWLRVRTGSVLEPWSLETLENLLEISESVGFEKELAELKTRSEVRTAAQLKTKPDLKPSLKDSLSAPDAAFNEEEPLTAPNGAPSASVELSNERKTHKEV